MPSSYTNLKYHLVFGTKLRQALITPELEERAYSYLGGIVSKLGGVAIEINGMPDHVHLLLSLHPTTAVANAAKAMKGGTSKWINEQKLIDATFGWQEGYAAFTVSESQTETVRRYIRQQKEHHHTKTFEEELEQLLSKHGIRPDKEHFRK
ncbi:MAG: IS200/IS605 family transposase [Thermoanaerobaculia bacterium]|nr:IS200/IS605 family transposase [Thermoanaerobaculia bacterium]